MKWTEWKNFESKKSDPTSLKELWVGFYKVGCVVWIHNQGLFCAYTHSPSGFTYGNEKSAINHVEERWLIDLNHFEGGIQ